MKVTRSPREIHRNDRRCCAVGGIASKLERFIARTRLRCPRDALHPQVLSVAIQSVPSDHEVLRAAVQDCFLCTIIARCKECFIQCLHGVCV